MKEKIKLRITLFFTIAYLIFFTILSLARQNYEFLYYTVFSIIVLVILVFHYKKLHLSERVLISLSVLGFLHFLGGSLYLEGVRLYDFYLIKNIFRYDHLMHFLGIFIATIIGYDVLSSYLKPIKKADKFLLFLILMLIGMGVGAVVEVIEFGAVYFLEASEQVGDYLNIALDLVYNQIGAITASIVILYYHKKKVK